jgi:hypothetical protein
MARKAPGKIAAKEETYAGSIGFKIPMEPAAAPPALFAKYSGRFRDRPAAMHPVTLADIRASWRAVAQIRERAGQAERAARAAWNAKMIPPGPRPGAPSKAWCRKGFADG